MPKRTELQLVPVPERRPSQLQRLREALRSYWSGPITSNSPEIARLWADPPTATGIGVNEWTALNYAAVWAAVSLIADDMASLPLMMYVRLPNGGKKRMDNHPLYPLLHSAPNPEMSTMVWRRTIQAHVLTWGNGYSEIVRDNANRVAALWPITPDRVTPFRKSADAALQYRVTNPGGGETFLPDDSVLHIPGLGFDGTTGYSVIQKARESLSLGIAAERFGGTIFGNGLTVGGVVTYPNDPPELTKKNNREVLNNRHQGVENAHKWLALYGGAKFERISIQPDDAQFLETRTFQVREIARWFKVPPHKLADLADATFSNVEQMNLDYYTSCLRPWLELWEQEIERKLIAPLERKQQFVEHIAEGLLRADAQGRSEFYSKQFSVAAITPNEIRNAENRDPVPGGDRVFIPLNMIAADRYDDWLDAEIAAKKPQPQAAPPPTAQPDAVAAKQREIEQLIEERDAARKKAQQAEDAKDVAISDHEQLLAEAAAKLAEVQAQREAAFASAVESGQECDRLKVQISELGRQVAEAQQHAADVERDGAARAEMLSAQLEREVRKHQETGEALSLDVIAGQQAHAKEHARANQAEADKATAEALLAELRPALAAAQEERAAVHADALSAREALAALDARLTASTDRLAQVEDRLAEREAAIAQADQQRQATRDALRGVAVDALNRLITKETDRARKAQGTPQKLTTLVENFYPQHADSVRAVLKPIVRAWLATVDAPLMLEAMLDEAVEAYISESTRSLRGLAHEHDPESLAPALERVLRRWESDRAEAVADRLFVIKQEAA